MSNAIFPAAVRGLDINVNKAAEWNTIAQQSSSFSELRIAQSKNPIWHWTLTYNYLKGHWDNLSAYLPYSDYEELQGFFLARQGKFDSFLYSDPYDNTVGPGITSLGVPVTTAQLQVVTDGHGNYYSPIQRNFGGLYYEDITDLNGSIAVYANGTLQTAGSVNYFVGGPGLTIPGYSFGGLYIGWVGSSVPAAPVTATFSYYFRVRFEEDTLDFERWLWELWAIGGPEQKSGSGELKMVTARPPGV